MGDPWVPPTKSSQKLRRDRKYKRLPAEPGLTRREPKRETALPKARRRGNWGNPGFPQFRFRKVLDRLDVHRLQALVALLDVELNTLSLGQ